MSNTLTLTLQLVPFLVQFTNPQDYICLRSFGWYRFNEKLLCVLIEKNKYMWPIPTHFNKALSLV